MATYVALTTINARQSGWREVARGTDRACVLAEADAAIGPSVDIYADTEQKNLIVVSLTKARRIAGRCALGECDHEV